MCVTKKLTSDIIDNRDVQALKGLDGCKVVLINKIDLLSYTTDASNHMIVKDITQAAGTSGFAIPNVKQANDVSSEFIAKDDDFDGHKHVLNIVIRKETADNLLQLDNLENNEEGVVAIVMNKFKGTNNQDAFKIYGIDAGLKVTTSTSNSKEYSKITLSTKDDALEVKRPRILRLGTFAETKTIVITNNAPA